MPREGVFEEKVFCGKGGPNPVKLQKIGLVGPFTTNKKQNKHKKQKTKPTKKKG